MSAHEKHRNTFLLRQTRESIRKAWLDPRHVHRRNARQGVLNTPAYAPTMVDTYAIEITGRILHRRDSTPMLPSVRQRLRCCFPAKIEAEGSSERPTQTRFNLGNELCELIGLYLIRKHPTPEPALTLQGSGSGNRMARTLRWISEIDKESASGRA